MYLVWTDALWPQISGQVFPQHFCEGGLAQYPAMMRDIWLQLVYLTSSRTLWCQIPMKIDATELIEHMGHKKHMELINEFVGI